MGTLFVVPFGAYANSFSNNTVTLDYGFTGPSTPDIGGSTGDSFSHRNHGANTDRGRPPHQILRSIWFSGLSRGRLVGPYYLVLV